MKININSLKTTVTTDDGHEIKKITNIDIHLGIDEVPSAQIRIVNPEIEDIEILDKNVEIFVEYNDLISIPTYQMISHLKELGFEVKAKSED